MQVRQGQTQYSNDEERPEDCSVTSRSGHPQDLVEQLRIREREIAGLKNQIREMAVHRSNMESLVNDILNSASWRITKPIRDAKRLAKALLPLLRFSTHRIQVGAGEGVTALADKNGVRYQSEGLSPSLTVKSSLGRLPSGFALLSARLRSPQSHQAFYLYYSEGSGFTGSQRYLITLEDGKAVEQLLRLPSSVQGIKFDPFDAKEPFAIDDFEIREIGTLQVAAHFFRKHLSPYLSNPRMFVSKVRRGLQLIRSGGFVALRVKLFADEFTGNYQEWVKRFDTLTDVDRLQIREHAAKLAYRPLISVVMPTYNSPEEWLRKAIESVRAQLYEHWELCIADDASPDAHVRRILEEYAARDSRIRFVIREKNGHIAEASNSAIEMVRGEFIALLDHDDELSEHALYYVAERLNRNRDLDLIYSDEDKMTSYGMRFNPYFKPDWNPALLWSQNYICHLGVYRTELVRKIGGFRAGTDGAQDWDLCLRVADATSEERIAHIPQVLYHWRVIEGSTAQSTSFKPYVKEAQIKAVSDHLQRRGVEGAHVSFLEDIAQLRVVFPLPKELPLVSLIIPTRNLLHMLERCVESILDKTEYKNFEILIVDNGSDDPDTLRYFEEVQKRASNVRVIRDDLPFNFSRLNNLAAKHARGEVLGLLNNDLEVITPEWLSEMVAHAVRPEIGAVGAQLWYPSDLLQHGGVILGIGGVAGHNHKGCRRGDPGYFNRIILPQYFSAVTAACLLMRRSVFEEVGGLNEVDFSVAFNDVDLCLRIGKAGYKLLYTPFAQFYHYESASRGYEDTPEKFDRFEREIAEMKRQWSHVLDCDPYYNPNLTLLSEDFSFAFPPRTVRPWRERGREKRTDFSITMEKD